MEFFLMQCCLESLGQHDIGFLPVQCCPKSIKAKFHRTIFYAMLSGVSHKTWQRLLPMQCCPKSTNTTLNRNFSHAMLSGASQATFHRVFSCEMLSGAFQATLHRVLTCAMLSQEYQGKMSQGFFMQSCLEPLEQYYIGFLPVQYCPISIKTTLNRIFPYTRVSGATLTTLNRIFTCEMLSQEC